MELIKESLIKASLVTFLVLVIGILAGLQVDDVRKDYVQDQLQQSNLRTQSLLVTQEYLEESSRDYCKVVDKRIKSISEQNTEVGRDLQSYSGKSISHKQDYKTIKNEYYVNQLRLYNILNEYKERCSSDPSLIFFFFDDSASSKRQGSALTKYYREVDNSTYIFSYNLKTVNSEVLELLRADYNVTEGPTIVINGGKTFKRYVSFEELREEL